MKIFEPYKNIISLALNNNDTYVKSFSDIQSEKRLTLDKYSQMRKDLSTPNELESLSRSRGIKVIENQKVGHHPDFIYLKGTKNIEKHNIVSTFIDVKGSTNLYKKYDNETVFIITDTIQLLGMTICKLFGGFIHRLQGDGLFVYFGGKGVNKHKGIHNALLATSLFNSFMENDLKYLFESHGIENIRTRIGIDFGDDKDVLWAMAGIGETSEITTISLHTSLAPKMQQNAIGNGTVIGRNVVDFGELDKSLYDIIDEKKRYVYIDEKKGFRYTQYAFNWLKYLKQCKNIITSPQNGMIDLKPLDNNLRINQMDTDNLRPIAKKSRPWLRQYD